MLPAVCFRYEINNITNKLILPVMVLERWNLAYFMVGRTEQNCTSSVEISSRFVTWDDFFLSETVPFDGVLCNYNLAMFLC